MPTHDYDLANQSGAAFRTDLNNALAAIQSNNSNSSSPSTTVAYQWWADTSASIFKIRNSANNAWINLFTLAGGIDVDANSNFSADVAFDGTGGQNITFDKSESAFIFNDNAKAVFGTSQDGLKIFHNGSHSFLEDSGTGNLFVKTNQISIENAAGNASLITAVESGAVSLFFNGSKKIESTANGMRIPDDVYLGLGDSDDLNIRFLNGI